MTTLSLRNRLYCVTFADISCLYFRHFLEENELIGDVDPIVCNLSDLHTLSDSRSDCLEDVGGIPEISCSCCNSCCNSFKCDSL